MITPASALATAISVVDGNHGEFDDEDLATAKEIIEELNNFPYVIKADLSKYNSPSKGELEAFKSGIYLHYKNHLYEATNLTHNASEGDRVEIAYVSLQLDGAQEGPRHATREFREFYQDRVHADGSTCSHAECDKTTRPRFFYLGPVFEAWMLEADPWAPPPD